MWQEQRRFLLHHLRDLGFGKSSYEPVMVEEVTELMDHLAKEEGRPIEMKVNCLPYLYVVWNVTTFK